MVDTLPPKSQWNSKFVQRESRDGTRTKGEGYICDVCSCNNDQAARCIFARWNRDGIMAAFSPDRRYREQHKRDIPDSPLVQAVAADPRMNLVVDYIDLAHKFDPKRKVVVPSYNQLERLAGEVRRIRRSIG